MTEPAPAAPGAAAAPSEAEFVYVGDVMCSWCWGFAPVLDRLQERFGLPMRVVNGGLRPGPHASPLNPELVSYLTGAWNKVKEATGQPFDPTWLTDRLEGPPWKFDSELPAIAVTVMRRLAPGNDLRFFKDLQYAFYAQGTDLTEPSAYSPLVAGYPVDADRFGAELVTPEAQRDAWADFQEARSMGVFGFPSLFLRRNGRADALARGYQPYEETAEIAAAHLKPS